MLKTIIKTQEGKHFSKPRVNTNNDYFQLRMNKEWKHKVRMISEMNNTTLSNFIRESVDKNIQSLSG